MEETDRQGLDRFAPLSAAGDRVELHNLTEQPLSPKDERIVSANPSSDEAIPGASKTKNVTPASETSGTLSSMHPFNSYKPQDQGYYFGGFDSSSGKWDEQSNYVNANSLHIIPPALYNENSSIFFPPGYGFDSQMAYGQYPPLPSPLSTIMVDGQLFSPHQMPVTPRYYPPSVSPGLPHATSVYSASQAEMLPPGSNGQENLIDSSFFGPGSGYYLPVGSFGGNDLSGNIDLGPYNFPGEFGSTEPLPNRSSSLDGSRFLSPLSSGTVYPQPIGIVGSYEQNVTQAPFHGFGLTSNSSSRQYALGSSYQGSVGSNLNRNRFALEKGGRRERDRDVIVPADSPGLLSDRNRGPRALKTKSKNSPDDGSSSVIKDVELAAGLLINLFNSPDFITDYALARFFVIKSFSEDNVHKSIKYSVWSSTPLGSRKLDAAFKGTEEMEGKCPLFLFFSVNASGQFCGVAEMTGHVDFDNDADYWQQDRWSGKFPVKWHIIKDVPNSLFRHILLENNDNKPVTHSRDSQEVKLEQGVEMLKIFKNYDSGTSLLDDFKFYDEREKSLLDKKAKQRAISSGKATANPATESINQLSNNLVDTLRLEGGKSLPRPTDLHELYS